MKVYSLKLNSVRFKFVQTVEIYSHRCQRLEVKLAGEPYVGLSGMDPKQLVAWEMPGLAY